MNAAMRRRDMLRLAGGLGAALLLPRRSFAATSNILEGFGSATAFTITNANLASSATAGWKSNAADNSTNLYDDALVLADFAAVNTAPANSKAIFFFAFGLIDTGGSIFTSTGDGTIDGTEGTVTYPDVSSLPIVAPLLGVLPYPVQNKALRGGPWSVAACFGGVLPDKWCIGMVNHSGMTLSVTSIKYQEVKYTVGANDNDPLYRVLQQRRIADAGWIHHNGLYRPAA